MPEQLDIKSEIQRLSTPDYSPGYTAPATDQAQQPAHLDTIAGTVQGGDAGHRSTTLAMGGRRRPAMQGSPNDLGWRVLSRAELQAARETVVPLAPRDGGVITLDPNQAGFWEISAAGSFSLSFLAPDPYDPPDPTAPAPYVALWLVVVVNRQPGGLITWPATVYWPASTDADDFGVAPTTTRTDVFVLVRLPNGGNPQWLGHVIAQGYALASNLTSSSGATTTGS